MAVHLQGISKALWPCAAVLLLSSALAACDGEEEKPASSYIVVKLATDQPSSDDFGRIVTVEAVGGRGLRIRTDGGTHTLPPSPAAVTETCMQPRAQRFSFLVRPADREAIVFLELTDTPPSESSSGAAGLAEACPGKVVASGRLVVNLDAVNMPTPDGGAGGGGPSGGSSGEGGTSGTSGAGAGGFGGSGGIAGSGGGGTSGSSGDDAGGSSGGDADGTGGASGADGGGSGSGGSSGDVTGGTAGAGGES